MNRSIAFFDTCSQHPNDDNTDFIIADKMARVRRSVREVLETAASLNAPVLSTTCLGIQRLNSGMCVNSTCTATCGRKDDGEHVFVAMNATEEGVRKALECRRILLERTSCKTGDENVRRRTFDVFATNPHAETIVRALGEREWFVFGAGFEHCLLAVVTGLRQLGLPVTVLASACIHGGRSTPASFMQTLREIERSGAHWETSPAIADLIRAKAYPAEALAASSR